MLQSGLKPQTFLISQDYVDCLGGFFLILGQFGYGWMVMYLGPWLG